ncbi:hypothetical protein JXA63_01995 [Candidatus Woesebacteria bacterium]|nr:hypothetical protein [Candidatus Woesebacteria bacterium]
MSAGDLLLSILISFLVVKSTPTSPYGQYKLNKNQLFNITFERFIMVSGAYIAGNAILSFTLFPTVSRIIRIQDAEALFVVIKLIAYSVIYLLSSALYKLVVKENDEIRGVSKYYSKGKTDKLIATTQEQKEVVSYTQTMIVRPILNGVMYIVVCMVVALVSGIIWLSHISN